MFKENKVRFLRKPDVLSLMQISRATLRNRINDGLFCPPVSIGGRSVAFIDSEVQHVLAAMAGEHRPEKIRELVQNLIDNRCRYSDGLEGFQ